MDEEMINLRARIKVLENVIQEMNQVMAKKFDLIFTFFNNKMDVLSKCSDEESRIYQDFRDEFLSISSTFSLIPSPAVIFPSSSAAQNQGSNSRILHSHDHEIFSLFNENIDIDTPSSNSINQMSKLESPRVPLSPIIHRNSSSSKFKNSYYLYNNKSSPKTTTTINTTSASTNQELKVPKLMIDSDDENGSPSLLQPRRKLFRPSPSAKPQVQEPVKLESFKAKPQVKKDRIPDSKLQVAIIDKRNKIAIDFDEPKPKHSNSPKYAYVPKKAIRGKKQRAQLEGWDCDVCVEYYKALGSQLDDDKIKELQNKCSRHRSKYQYRSAHTPPGYWRTDFPSTQSCRDLGIGYYGQNNSDEDAV